MKKARTTKLCMMMAIAALGLACGNETDGMEGSGSNSTSGGGVSSDGATSNAVTTVVMTGSAEGDTTNAESTSSGPPGDTTTESSGSSSGSSETTPPGTEGSTTSGGPPGEPAYPMCENMDVPCPEPYDQCAVLGPGGGDGQFCTLGCMDADDCPVPDTGEAEVVCTGLPGKAMRCELDCSRGDCPDGMDCVDLGPPDGLMRCAWPPA